MSRSASEIQEWIVARVADSAGLPPADVDPDAPFTRHGLDSVAAISLISDLERWAGYRFRENPLDRHPTIRAISEYLAARIAENAG